ncbi:MAG: hypothetical protein LBP36_04375 [Oscillospiraceae bacterium]|jgi:hypothetical protein|nr:hypothetical protein [Oscillospiraceae bacterium]
MKSKLLLLFLGTSMLLAQNIIFILSPSQTVNLSKETKFYIDRTGGGITNNIFVIECGNNKKFFKECKKKLSMYDTVKRTVAEYFKGEYENEQQSILNSMSDEENLKKFFYMKIYGDGQAAKWLNSSDKSDTSILGLTEPLNDKFKTEVLTNFLHYAFAEFFQYRFNETVKIGEIQSNQALNNLATIRIAELLNLSDLVVKTEYVKITYPEIPDKFGILMDCAKGIPFEKFKSLKNKSVSPLFQLKASNLMILDAICAQRDREVGNYFTVISEDTNSAVSINAFDNDMAFHNIMLGKFVNLKEKYYVLPPIISADDKMTLPHMDKELAEKILSLNDKTIYLCLQNLLPDISIDAVINRLHQIQNAIRKTIKYNENFLIEPMQWNEKTMEEELTQSNETYFKNFMKKLNTPD